MTNRFLAKTVSPALSTVFAALAGTVAVATGLACSQSAPQSAELDAKWKDASFYDLEVRNLDGTTGTLQEYAGKVTLVVNVASQCGFTGQYAGLQKIYDRLREKGFVVIGVPSGDFGGQEFDTADEIRNFCDTRYSVTFPLLEKSVVKAGDKQSVIFQCLGTKTGELPGWNFGKYVVSRDGKRAVFFPSTASPESAKVVEAIERFLAEPAPETAKKSPKKATEEAAEKSTEKSTEKTPENSPNSAPATPKS
jgi:glutathione peroxidase